MKVLIVDDNADLRETMRLMLDLIGHDVTTSGSAAEALEKAPSCAPDVVFLDIGLPDMDGFDACAALRRRGLPESSIIVAHSGRDSTEDRKAASAAGFDRFLVKPVSFEYLEQFLKLLSSD